MLKLKEQKKQSSVLTQFMKNLLSESLTLLQILLQAKSSFLVHSNLDGKFGAQGKILLKVHKLNERFPA